MKKSYIPINKGNYSMDTEERQELFDRYRGEGWDEEYSKYRKDWSELPRKQIVSDYPLLLDIELSSICNLKCPMCYTITDHFKSAVNTKRMDYELFTKIIDEISGKVPAIRLSLRGEATLHPKFINCIAYAKQKKIKEVSILTHGGKLTLPYFKKIVEAGIDWITISIDGVGETYESIRKPIKFNDLVEKIKAIKKYKDENDLHRPVIKVQGIWPAIKKNIELYYETFSPYVDLIAFNPLIDYLDKDIDIEYMEGFTCPQQYQRLVIGADGLVVKCSNDEENQEIIGDINKQTVHAVWHGLEMKKHRELQLQSQGFMKSDVCKKCYLPRKTKDEENYIHGRKFLVKNYTKRNQVIGK